MDRGHRDDQYIGESYDFFYLPDCLSKIRTLENMIFNIQPKNYTYSPRSFITQNLESTVLTLETFKRKGKV